MQKLSSVEVLGQNIPIVEVSAEEFGKVHKEGYAAYKSHEIKIIIRDDLGVSLYWRSLAHEIKHAVLNLSGLTHFLTEDLEEALCELNENFINFIQKNPGLLAEFIEDHGMS